MPIHRTHWSMLALVSICGLASISAAQDWNNSGGNAGRNGLSTQIGPDSAALLWSTGRPSLIGWQPVVEGDRIFVVRQSGFPPEPNSNLSPVVAMNLNTGAELWFKDIVFNTGEWSTWIAGVNGGRVYASRSGGGGAVTPPPTGQAKMYGFDVATGNVVFTSVGTTCAGPYDGVVFAPNGDLIIGDFLNITRIRASDGVTAWQRPRVGSASGTCGAAINAAANAVYIVDAVGGGHTVKRYDLDTGNFRYQSPTMPGFLSQSTPMVAPDGTICFSRTQNNAPVDNYYAFTDTGSAITQRWTIPAAWTTHGECAVGPDGSIFMLAPGYIPTKLDPLTGAVRAAATVVGHSYSQRMGVDALGRLFYSDGDSGILYSFNPDLSLRYSIPVPGVNQGAPAIAHDGTLVLAGTGSVSTYRTTHSSCYANCDQSTSSPLLTANDFQCFLNRYAAGESYANCDGSTSVPLLTANDFQCFLNAYAAGCS